MSGGSGGFGGGFSGHVVVGNNYHWQHCYLSQGSFTLTLKRYLSQELPFATPLPFDKF